MRLLNRWRFGGVDEKALIRTADVGDQSHQAAVGTEKPGSARGCVRFGRLAWDGESQRSIGATSARWRWPRSKRCEAELQRKVGAGEGCASADEAHAGVEDFIDIERVLKPVAEPLTPRAPFVIG